MSTRWTVTLLMLVPWAIVAAYHVRQGFKRSHFMPFVVAVYPLGWPCTLLIAYGYVQRPHEDWILNVGVVLGLIAAWLSLLLWRFDPPKKAKPKR